MPVPGGVPELDLAASKRPRVPATTILHAGAVICPLPLRPHRDLSRRSIPLGILDLGDRFLVV